MVLRRDAVEDARVPVVEDGGEVVQEHHRYAAGLAELAVGERGAVDVDRLGGVVFQVVMTSSFVSGAAGVGAGMRGSGVEAGEDVEDAAVAGRTGYRALGPRSPRSAETGRHSFGRMTRAANGCSSPSAMAVAAASG